MRLEKDSIGEIAIPANDLYGIHSVRARNNFPDSTTFHKKWFSSMGVVKKACYITTKEYYLSLKKKYGNKSLQIKPITEEIMDAMIVSADEITQGKYFDQFIIPAISGGAGTSINMNVNEIIANASLIHLGYKPGDYKRIDPIEQCNIFQSTNDVVPTSLKLTILKLLNLLEDSINELRNSVEKNETNSSNYVRISYTQMQEAVPSSFGRLFSAYSDALSRDWWRVSKCNERIKMVNLGGSAIGSGISVPKYIMIEVVQTLQKITGFPLTRSENRFDTTSNLDSYVEIHAILKAHAVNLEKIANDLRLLSSDIGPKEINIPAKQAGSSIMPSKVNPVISEYVISVAHKVYSNDMLISNLCGQGCLELNAYIPSIGHALIDSIQLLTTANNTFNCNLVKDIVFNNKLAFDRLIKSPSITTSLLPYVGYNKAELLAKEMKKQNSDIFYANKCLKILEESKLKEIIRPENILKEGFTISDLVDLD